ncbi:hypothetical protein B0I21_101288 [Sphingobacterium paludis]|jgi:hypothetical protein|uniref:Uncharacterized protein n=1 Tax=Sphingobacterium paludis TaxID=1476465 RepID=A0A4R7D850_9SPHI|nr:hypothetical protein B0I21_101288 [Sphingobacterium paludis]
MQQTEFLVEKWLIYLFIYLFKHFYFFIVWECTINLCANVIKFHFLLKTWI